MDENIGKKIGEWIVISFSHVDNSGKYYLCRCSCGFEKANRVYLMARGKALMCRTCYLKTITTHNMSNSSTMIIWADIKQRCLNEKDKAYKNYGGRGITVCDKWLSFSGFLEDMGARPEGLTIDRIDNDKGYSKDNCRWTTYTENNNNRRNSPSDEQEIGKKFGRWLAVGRVEHKSNRRHYLCRCECGNENIKNAFQLRSGKTTQCKSCSVKETWGNRKNDNAR